MKTSLYGKVRTEIHDAKTGRVVKKSRWQKNLVFDSGLNTLAGNGGMAAFFSACQVGSSNSPNSIASGAVTFTQSGTTITASSSFFTSAMVGGIIKYGSGTAGAEQYIVSQTGTACVVSGAGMTVGTPTVATVWLVQQTSLKSFLYGTTTYITTNSGCGYQFSGSNGIIMKRTFQFATQASTYNVNEIGYGPSPSGGSCAGRVVLSSTDVVAPTQFYVVVMQMTYNIAPVTQVAFGNTGTGINIAGTGIIAYWCCQTVTTGGGTTSINAGGQNRLIDGSDLSNSQSLGLITNSGFSLPSLISQGTAPSVASATSYNQLCSGTFSNSGQAVGVGVASFSYSFSTNGETLYALQLGANVVSFYLLLTTPFTLPVGGFSGTFSLQLTFTRTLSN